VSINLNYLVSVAGVVFFIFGKIAFYAIC